MDRKDEIEAAVAEVRKIEKRDGVTRESLEKIKQRLIRLARPALFPASDFPPPAPVGVTGEELNRFYDRVGGKPVEKGESMWRVFPAHADIREAR